MKRTIVLAMAWAIVGGASAFAAQSAAQKPDQQMTYTGCVAPGKMAGTFMLTNVMAGDGMKKPNAATAKMAPKELTARRSRSTRTAIIGSQSWGRR